MLARSSFCNDPGLAHPPGEQNLAHCVVDFVSARVQKVLPLEINSRPPEPFAESLGIVERRRPSTERAQQAIQLQPEFWISASPFVLFRKLLNRRH